MSFRECFTPIASTRLSWAEGAHRKQWNPTNFSGHGKYWTALTETDKDNELRAIRKRWLKESTVELVTYTLLACIFLGSL